MDNYYVSKKVNNDGFHIVHKRDCPNIPKRKDSMYLGYFTNCTPAIQKAKTYFEPVCGCKECSKNCARPNGTIGYFS